MVGTWDERIAKMGVLISVLTLVVLCYSLFDAWVYSDKCFLKGYSSYRSVDGEAYCYNPMEEGYPKHIKLEELK